jgi:hypothetical protein
MIDLQLDLSTQRAYLSSLALIRQRIELGRAAGDLPAVQRFRVRLLSDKSVELFMLSANLYLIGFRGAAMVYALTDDKLDCKADIERSTRLDRGETVQKISLKGDHGSLGTFSRPFVRADLELCNSLSEYSGGNFETIKRSFSLLVCMLAEGSRFLEVQNSFAGIGRSAGRYFADVLPDKGLYNHEPIAASDVVNYWDNASRARRVANGAGFGVTEGHVLAVKLKSGIAELEKLLSERHIMLTKTELYSLVAGERRAQLPSSVCTGDVGKLIATLQEIAKQAKLTSADKLDEFVVALQNKIAVDYANGVLLPTMAP